MTTLDVIGLGSAFVDYFFKTDASFLKKHDLRPEDDVFFDDRVAVEDVFKHLKPLAKSPGGMTLNTLMVLEKLKIKTAYYGVIGKDSDGKFWQENTHFFDSSHIIKAGETSPCACLLTNGGKQRTFISWVNPEDNVLFENIDYQFLNSANMVYLSPFLKDVEETFQKVASVVNKLSKPKISFTMWAGYQNLGLKNLLPVLQKTEVLFCNRNELKTFVGKDEKEASREFIKLGVQIVACTLGEKGALITTKNKQFFSPSIKPEKIIDTTGAGDAFAAGFLYGLLQKKSLEETGAFANKIAAKSITDYGLEWFNNYNH